MYPHGVHGVSFMSQESGKERVKKELPKSRQMLAQQMKELYEGAARAKQEGKLIGWSSSIFPQEIPEALGLYILYPENHAAGVAARHQAEDLLKYAEGTCGYSNDICAYAKINLAFAETETCEGYVMPKPDFLLVANNICNQITKWFENLAQKWNIPLFMVDTCYNYEDTVTEARIKYIRTQLDELIENLEALCGKKLDQQRLETVMEISRKNRLLWEHANELLAVKPAPLSGFDLFNYMFCMVCCRGKEETTAILKQLIEEINEHIRQGTSTYPAKEEFRVFWEGIACWPYLRHNLRTLKQHGINVVATGYVKAWSLEYEDMDGMARAYSSAPVNNNNLNTVLTRREAALRQFGCDGVIYHLNRSCKLMDCQQFELQRQLYNRTGVPYTSFDGDQADFRNYSEAQFETRIQGLTEVMQANREKKENGTSEVHSAKI